MGDCQSRQLEAGKGGPSNAVHSATLLKAAASLEVHLLQQARCVLAASEEDRKRMSLQLNDEAAQSLFGIQFRLSALRKKIAAGDADVSPEIASTRHLVEQSIKIILRIASEFEPPHETRTN